MDVSGVADLLHGAHPDPEGAAWDGGVLEEDLDVVDAVLLGHEAHRVVLCGQGANKMCLTLRMPSLLHCTNKNISTSLKKLQWGYELL